MNERCLVVGNLSRHDGGEQARRQGAGLEFVLKTLLCGGVELSHDPSPRE